METIEEQLNKQIDHLIKVYNQRESDVLSVYGNSYFYDDETYHPNEYYDDPVVVSYIILNRLAKKLVEWSNDCGEITWRDEDSLPYNDW